VRNLYFIRSKYAVLIIGISAVIYKIIIRPMIFIIIYPAIFYCDFLSFKYVIHF
jgi:hypothetical protein